MSQLGNLFLENQKRAKLTNFEFAEKKLVFSNVVTDTRESMAGSLFIALKGDKFNAHDFLSTAKQQGAVACLVDETKETTLPVLKVLNTQFAMAQLAQSIRQQLSIPFIGVTGSCGKTTVKEMIASILACKGRVLATKGNFNNAVGVPLTLFRLTEEHQFAVVEMGASKLGDIDEIAQLVMPDVALITSISAAHLQGLGSLDGVAKVKGELLDHLTEKGTAVLEHDSPWLHQWCEQLSTSQGLMTFSIENKEANYHASSISLDKQGRANFRASTPLGNVEIDLPLAGRLNVSNALAAMAAAITVGATLEACQKGLSDIQPVKGRLQLLKGLAGSLIIDDSYNANPASLKVALELLKTLPGKTMLVLGDMAELGDQAEAAHRDAGKLAKVMDIDGFFATGKLSQVAVDSFGVGAKHFATRELLSEAIKTKITTEQSSSVNLSVKDRENQPIWNLLIKGSRSAGMEKLVTDLQIQQQKTGIQSCY